MTCAACQATVQRALARAPGVTKAAVNLMTNEATVHYDPAGTDPAKLVSAINDTGYVSHLPAGDSSPVSDDEAREQAEAREYSVLLRKAVVSVILGALAMVASMPLMGGSHGEHGGDPFIAWAMRVLDPPVRRLLPWLYCDRSGHPALHAPRVDDLRDGVGGAALLRRRVEEPAAWCGKHEHADRDRHRRGVHLLAGRDGRAPALERRRNEPVAEALAKAGMCITKR